MSIFRRKRLSEEQLQQILGSLPAMKAADDFEEQLDRMISLHSEHVPHMLGAMPMVPAPDDFDARLMQAIGDERPVAPLPASIIAGGASISWLNHIMGWMGGSLAVVLLAFVIHDAGNTDATVAPTARQEAPQAAQRTAATGSVGAPPSVASSRNVAADMAQSVAPAAPSEITGAIASAERPADVIAGDRDARQLPNSVASMPAANGAATLRLNRDVVVPATLNRVSPQSAGDNVIGGTESSVSAPTSAPASSSTSHHPPSQMRIDTHTVPPAANVSAGDDTTSAADKQPSLPEIINTGRPAESDPE